ncbi:MAG TPA: metal ABC transporter ATP-binding protein [Actinotalea sp.]|nr:metal ABC transporter ATP-binding protein [Actinotalea sp.]
MTALQDVGLDVAQGQACGLVGVNGSGKSTLIAAVLGLVRADAGEVRVLGESSRSARAAGRIGYVPQVDQVDRDFPVSVRDVVLTGRYRRGSRRTRTSRSADAAAVDEALDRVGLADLGGRQIGRLSGGQRQRVLLARALAQQASVLLLDEPFTGLDVASQESITRVLRQVVADGGAALVASHDLVALPALCERAVLLHRTVLAAGPVAEVLTPEQLARAFGLGARPGAPAAEPGSGTTPAAGGAP